MYRLLTILFFFSFISAQTVDKELTISPKEMPTATALSSPEQEELYRNGSRKVAGGAVMITSGIAAISAGTLFGILLTAFGGGSAGTVLMLTAAAGGTALTVGGARVIRSGRELRAEAGVPISSQNQFRIAVQFQGYLDSNLMNKSQVYSNHPFDPDLGSWNRYHETRPPKPHFGMEMGILTGKDLFYGIYGQLLYIGAMAVVYREWNPWNGIYLSAGAKAGYLQEGWTQGSSFAHHVQYGGPELRISAGTRAFKLTAQFQLWIDKVAQYTYGDYGEEGTWYSDENRGYAPLSLKVGASPALSIMVQFGIPGSE